MRMLRLSFVLLSMVWLLSGCAHEVVELTHDGKLVMRIEPDQVEQCKYLHQVQAFTGSDDEENLNNSLRNAVGAAGGNAYVQLSTFDTDTELGAKADAYKCPPK